MRYKDYILPLIFYKRIDDVFSDELERVGKALALDAALAGALVDTDRNLVRFYLPAEARWQTIRGLVAGLGERITDNLRAIARENPDLVGMAVVLDTGAASRGSGNKGRNAERDIRKQFVEQDAIGSVILLPENLFFNTSAPGIIVVATKPQPGQPRPHAGELLLSNASKFCVKGRPKNEMTDAQVAQAGALFLDWRAAPDVSVVVSQAEVARNDYNLSPSRYVASNDADAPLPLEEALVLLAEAEEARAAADVRLGQVLASLGLRDKPGFSEKPGL